MNDLFVLTKDAEAIEAATNELSKQAEALQAAYSAYLGMQSSGKQLPPVEFEQLSKLAQGANVEDFVREQLLSLFPVPGGHDIVNYKYSVLALPEGYMGFVEAVMAIPTFAPENFAIDKGQIKVRPSALNAIEAYHTIKTQSEKVKELYDALGDVAAQMDHVFQRYKSDGRYNDLSYHFSFFEKLLKIEVRASGERHLGVNLDAIERYFK